MKHNAKLRSLYLGAMHRCSVVMLSAAMQASRGLTTRLNRFGRVLSPTFSWTAIGVFCFLEEGQPMLLHVHPCDHVPLSCKFLVGAHGGGELWTSGLLDCYGARLRPSWVQWDGDRLYGGTISPREGVALNAYRPHCPMPWTGERCGGVFLFNSGVDQHHPRGCLAARGNRIFTLTDSR